jgi:hypothetical protein
VKDHIQVDVGCSPPPFLTLSDDLIGVWCTPATTDALVDPSSELLLQFEPVLGQGNGLNMRPSILYWRNEFWTPILDLGDLAEVLSAVLYRVVVSNPPTADIFDLTDRNKV